MKRDFLKDLGLETEVIDKIMAEYGKSMDGEKKKLETMQAERDDLTERLKTAGATIEKFNGVDPEALRSEIEKYKADAAKAEERFNAQMTARDQRDWINARLDKAGIKSPYARRALIHDAMNDDSGLTWKNGEYTGFDEFINAAAEKDESLLPKSEPEQAPAQTKPSIVGKTGSDKPEPEAKRIPRLF